jgi:hypothetical protein
MGPVGQDLAKRSQRSVPSVCCMLALLGFGIYPPQCSQRIVAARGRSGKLELLDLVFGDLVHAHSCDLRLLRQPPTVFVIRAGVGLEPSRLRPLKEILRIFTKHGRLAVERVAALDRGSEFESGDLLRSGFVDLLGRPAVALAAHREVIPVILRLLLSESFHEITSKQPARKQLVCSANQIPSGTTTSYIALPSTPIQSARTPTQYQGSSAAAVVQCSGASCRARTRETGPTPCSISSPLFRR